jgi:hypothetical protein
VEHHCTWVTRPHFAASTSNIVQEIKSSKTNTYLYLLFPWLEHCQWSTCLRFVHTKLRVCRQHVMYVPSLEGCYLFHPFSLFFSCTINAKTILHTPENTQDCPNFAVSTNLLLFNSITVRPQQCFPTNYSHDQVNTCKSPPRS